MSQNKKIAAPQEVNRESKKKEKQVTHSSLAKYGVLMEAGNAY